MANGIFVVDKPAGWTSQDVAAKLRGVFHEKRVGHGGTLDPMATGVLPIFVGRATRAAQFLESADKEYVAGLRLGVVTDTQDICGNVLSQQEAHVTREALEAALAHFTGELDQIPPMYSAVKVHGQRLYALARKGQEVERKPRSVTIFQLELAGRNEEGDFLLRCRCSKGTYLRTLCHDIGAFLGPGGTMTALRRTMAAGYSLSEAVSLEDIQEKGEALLRPMDTLFAGYPAYAIPTEGKERRARCGNPITAPGLADGTYRVYDRAGELLCLSRAEGGTLTSIKNFFGG